VIVTSVENDEVKVVGEHEFTCFLCSKSAGQVRLEMQGDRPRMLISSFTGRVTSRVPEDAIDELEAALSEGDVQTLFSVDLEFAPFYCPACSESYCDEHWTSWAVFEEDGWYDSTRGKCPHGHERMLSD
jgi:hypothetical protein